MSFDDRSNIFLNSLLPLPTHLLSIPFKLQCRLTRIEISLTWHHWFNGSTFPTRRKGRQKEQAQDGIVATRLLDLVSNIMQCQNWLVIKKLVIIEIPAVIDEVCTLVSSATDKANRPILSPLVKFENKLRGCDARLPVIEGDTYKITQVMYNIITNAYKFCKDGSITVDARVNGDRVEISVTDTGVGVHQENVKRIFGKWPRCS